MAFSGSGGNKPFSPFTVSNPAGHAPAPVAPVTGSFSFGGGIGGTGGGAGTGISFGGGGALPAATASAPQLSFTAPTPAATSAGLFNFGNPTATTAAPTTAASGLGFGFGAGVGGITPTTSTTSGFASFGAPATQASSISFGAGLAAPAAVPAATVAAPAPISFTSVPPATVAGSVLPSFGLATTSQSTSTTGLSLSTSATSVAAPTGFSFGGGAGAGTGSLNLVKPTTTTAAIATAAAPSVTQTGAAPAQLPAGTTTTQASAASASVSQMNFRQLQESINKWMIDIQEQEKQFLEHATKVNAWDRTLIANGDKISKLNESITKVKSDHARLEHALDYLKTQQHEFETFLQPLEAGLPMSVPVEPEREQLYTVTESVDTQLQQMTEDLKEVIRHINEANKVVDKTDPVSQILRILNEHMDALHWIEDSTNQIKKSLDDTAKKHQAVKKDHERSVRNMFK